MDSPSSTMASVVYLPRLEAPPLHRRLTASADPIRRSSPVGPQGATSQGTSTGFTPGSPSSASSSSASSLVSSSPASPAASAAASPADDTSSSSSPASSSPASSSSSSSPAPPAAKPKRYLAHYRPIHVKSTASILSHNSMTPSPSYSGFHHLAMIALSVGNLRLMLHDYQKYGFFMTLLRLGIGRSDLHIAALLIASTPLHLLVALGIEWAAAKSATRSRPYKPRHLWRLFAALHALNAMLSLLITSVAVYTSVWHPLIGTICMCHSVVLCLKVSSYALTNRDLRDAYVDKVPVPELYNASRYPHNLKLSGLVYFWWAPTLVYQPEYPRMDRIHWGFLLNRVLEMAGSLVAIWFLSGQYAMPVLENSLDHFHQLDYAAIAEDILQLATVSMLIWLLGFFFIFQSYLNFLAEITRFGDREFYQDWWNAGSVGTYWRLWNKPVSNYLRRHVYSPLMQRGWSSFSASLVVFLISAVLHEVLVGVPTRNIIGVAFASMMLQVPLIYVTAPLEKMRGPATTIGNCIFWVSFFLGQPFAVLMYYYAWNLKHGFVDTLDVQGL